MWVKIGEEDILNLDNVLKIRIEGTFISFITSFHEENIGLEGSVWPDKGNCDTSNEKVNLGIVVTEEQLLKIKTWISDKFREVAQIL